MNTPDMIGQRVSRWGEGPVWWDRDLWYVDIEGHTLIRVHHGKGPETSWNMGKRIGFLRPCESGKLIWGGDGGLYFFDPDSGESTPIVNPEPDLPQNRFNDAGTAPDGRLFAGTIAMDKTQGAASLYQVDASLKPVSILSGLTNSNGIAWSPDGSKVYHIDTPARQVREYRYVGGEFLHATVAVDTHPLVHASPDGMCVDQEGRLWIAFCHGGCVLGCDPTGRTAPIRIDLPCRETTACCFGGPTLSDLYVTTGMNGPENDPGGGRLFVIRNMTVPGMPVIPFKDQP